MSTTYLDTSEAVTQVIANENQIEIPFNFPIYDEKDIEVLKTDSTTGDYVTLALTTDYTVASQYISDVNGQVAGGFITLVTPAIADDKYTCRLNVDIELDTKYTIAGDSMSQSAYVDSQNRVNLQIFQILQQFRRDINNAVTLAPDAVGQASTLPDPADLDAVVNNEANINTVAGNATNINTVANNITNINTANANAGNVNLVAGSIDNMNSVAGSIDNMNSVAGSLDNMNTVAGSIDNMNSVAGSIDNMNSVAGNIGNVNAVVTNQTNINTVAGNITTMQDAINAVPKNNFSATTNPTNANDVNDGYTIGSEWVNTSSNRSFICIDNSAGASVWVSQGASIVDMQEFTSSGTWTAPSNANYIFLYGIGGGGGAGGITDYNDIGGAGGSTIITGTNFNITLGGGGGGKAYLSYAAGLNGSVSYSLNSYFTIPIEKDPYGLHRSIVYHSPYNLLYRPGKKGTYYGAGGYDGGSYDPGSNGGDGGSIQIYIKDFPNSLTINIGSAGSANGSSSSSGMGNSGQVKIISFG